MSKSESEVNELSNTIERLYKLVKKLQTDNKKLKEEIAEYEKQEAELDKVIHKAYDNLIKPVPEEHKRKVRKEMEEYQAKWLDKWENY